MNRTKIFSWAAIVTLSAAIVAFFTINAAKHPDADTAASPLEAVYNVDGHPVRLGEGGVKYFGNSVMADLDGNGKADDVFLFTRDAGGSGTFFYVAAALKSDAGYVGTDAVFLGDRIAPQPTVFMGGRIVVNYAERKAGEPMTARPSMGVSRYFQVTDGRLVEILK